MQGKRVVAAPRAPEKVYYRLYGEVSSELNKQTTDEAKTSAITTLIRAEYLRFKRIGKLHFISCACKDYGLTEDQISAVTKKFEAAKSQFRKNVSGESSLSLLVGFIIQNSKTPPSPSPRFHANSATELAARQSQLKVAPIMEQSTISSKTSPWVGTLHSLNEGSAETSSMRVFQEFKVQGVNSTLNTRRKRAGAYSPIPLGSSFRSLSQGISLKPVEKDSSSEDKCSRDRLSNLIAARYAVKDVLAEIVNKVDSEFGPNSTPFTPSQNDDQLSVGSVEHVGVPRSTPLSLTRSTAEIDGSGHGSKFSDPNEENRRSADFETGEIPEIIEGILSEIFSGKELKFFQNSTPVPLSDDTSSINSWASSSSGDGSDSISGLAALPHAGDQEIEGTLADMLAQLEAEHNTALRMISSNGLRSDGSGVSTSNEENSRFEKIADLSTSSSVDSPRITDDDGSDQGSDDESTALPTHDNSQTAMQLAAQQSELFSSPTQITGAQIDQFNKDFMSIGASQKGIQYSPSMSALWNASEFGSTPVSECALIESIESGELNGEYISIDNDLPLDLVKKMQAIFHEWGETGE